jgi:hypothetical protein
VLDCNIPRNHDNSYNPINGEEGGKAGETVHRSIAIIALQRHREGNIRLTSIDAGACLPLQNSR